MASFLVSLSTWLHSLATIVMVGYFFFNRMIYLPVFERQMKLDSLRELLELVAGRLRPFFGGSLLVFLVTGTHLMVINQDYLGLGNFFGNTWSILIVVKHVLVLAFLLLAVISERVFLQQTSELKPEALTQYRRALNIDLALGVVILLLTSIAQAG